MYNQTERELKVMLDRKQYEAIKDAYPWEETIMQENIYYDDADLSLRQRGALRIRKTDGKNIFTLKIRKDPITQLELEKEVDADTVQKIRDPEVLGWMHKQAVPADLVVIGKSKTERRICSLPHAQLCLDHSWFADGKVEDYELEYEYMEDHDGLSAFNAILKPFGISYEKNGPSKIARALASQNL